MVCAPLRCVLHTMGRIEAFFKVLSEFHCSALSSLSLLDIPGPPTSCHPPSLF